VIHDVNHEAGKTINKVFPRPRLAGKTAFQQIAVNVGKRHVDSPPYRLSPTAPGLVSE
jgi:hypothetical protein